MSDDLREKAQEWDPATDARFVSEDGQEITFPVLILRLHGEDALPSFAGTVRHARSRWKWSGREPEDKVDPITAFGTAGFAACRDMAELLTAQQAHQVEMAGSLSRSLNELIQGFGEGVSTLLATASQLAGERALQSGTDARMEVVTEALGVARAWVEGGGGKRGEALQEWERLRDIAKTLGAGEMASALEVDKPGDLPAWIKAKFAFVQKTILENKDKLDSLSLADKAWLAQLRERAGKAA